VYADDMLNKIHSQKGSAHAFIIIILIVAIIGALGFVFWQHFLSKESTPTATPVVTAPDMIRYDTADQSGVTITSATDVAKLTNAPGSFKTFITQEITTDNKDLKNDPTTTCPNAQINVKKIYKQQYAIGFSGACASSSEVLWGYINGTWITVATTQNTDFACTDLVKYKVPAAIAGSTCGVYTPDGTPHPSSAYSQK
jgi:hypothetical protein